MNPSYDKAHYDQIADAIAKNFAFADRLNAASDFGFIYSGKWGGIPSILKLEPIDSGNNEASKAKIVMQARETAGSLADYLPKIWKVGEIKTPQGAGFSYIVMEKLEPLPADLKTDLFQRLNERAELDPNSPLEIFKQKDILRSVLSKVVTKTGSYGDHHLAVEMVVHAISAAAEEMKAFSSAELAKNANVKLAEYLRQYSSEKFVKALLRKGSIDESIIDFAVDSVMNTKKMPQYHGDPHLPSDENSVAAQAIQALKLLSAAGLHWNDVHEDNVLYRKSTKTPVFIDFGLYSLE